MKIYDLSHTLSAEMDVFPGSDPPEILQASTITRDGFAEKKIIMHSHNGTHIDAPAHVFKGKAHLDDLAVDRFMGEAMCIKIDGSVIDKDILLPHTDHLKHLDFILFATGWGKYWGEEQYHQGYPVLSQEAATLLSEYNLKGIGLDTISADHVDSVSLPIHKILLAKMLIVENLTNLDALPHSRFFFSCLPLKISKADGSPVRAVAIYF